jgi:Ca2+-binding EF-hand superfamily protein
MSSSKVVRTSTTGSTRVIVKERVVGGTRTYRAGLSTEDTEDIRQAFEMLDPNSTGMFDLVEFKSAIKSFGYDSKNPAMWQAITSLDNSETSRKGGVDVDALTRCVNDRFVDTESKDGIKRIFDFFNNETEGSNTLSLTQLKKLLKDYGSIPDYEINEIISTLGKGTNEINFDQFYDVMSKTNYP